MFHIVRNGNIVVLVVPSKRGSRKSILGVVVSLWKNQKKPQLSTSGISLTHTVAARCLELEQDSLDTGLLRCNANSIPWVVKPQAIAAVLDVEACDNMVDGLVVRLSKNSLTYVDTMHEVPKWWPVDNDAEMGESELGKAGLYVPRRRGRARGKARAKAKAKCKTKDTDNQIVETEAGGKKTRRLILKRRKRALKNLPTSVAFAPMNIKKKQDRQSIDSPDNAAVLHLRPREIYESSIFVSQWRVQDSLP